MTMWDQPRDIWRSKVYEFSKGIDSIVKDAVAQAASPHSSAAQVQERPSWLG
jgi:hypothetical protein